jgi:hypothetical protein
MYKNDFLLAKKYAGPRNQATVAATSKKIFVADFAIGLDV